MTHPTPARPPNADQLPTHNNEALISHDTR
ncbi:hypothetical protein JOM49_001221 [Amycolatopsis magusensis]|uniref:Uncharacterized protein n=1 Tax=Amycolatopsis magusensis TaxID=882444 RepID=A0ABS4PJX3_9PSEU|nr:hypothetical protein [Amycolatopsis magusensis]